MSAMLADMANVKPTKSRGKTEITIQAVPHSSMKRALILWISSTLPLTSLQLPNSGTSSRLFEILSVMISQCCSTPVVVLRWSMPDYTDTIQTAE